MLLAIIACDFVCQKRNAFLMCLPKVDPVNGVLRVFPGLRHVITMFFFIFGTPWVLKE